MGGALDDWLRAGHGSLREKATDSPAATAQFAHDTLGAAATLKIKARQLFDKERAAVAKESGRFKREGGGALRPSTRPD